MGQVQTVLTPATPAQLYGTAAAVLPGDSSFVAARMIAGQSEVETFHGSAMHNWNCGNVTVACGTAAQCAVSPTPWMIQGTNKLRFQAFPDLRSGMHSMIYSFLKRMGALPYALAGDLNGYVGALQKGGYLGFVGSTDPNGITTTQQDYTNYQNGIQGYMNALAKLQPDYSLVGGAPASPTQTLLIASGILAGAGAVALAVTVL